MDKESTDLLYSWFTSFLSATSIQETSQAWENLKEILQVENAPTDHNIVGFIQEKLNVQKLFKAKSLIDKLLQRANLPDYHNPLEPHLLAGHGSKVLIIGAGPAGLRTAMELLMLGCDVHLIEKRNDFSRNNIIHLWPVVIEDLIKLGVKVIVPKFCTGDLDHISIRQMQLILLKMALLLGLKFYSDTSFVSINETSDCVEGEKLRWQALVEEKDSPINDLRFDVIIGASGVKQCLPKFQILEDKRALAIGITANFVNRNSPEEQKVCELSGAARQFHQNFFNQLNDYCGIDLENIVYYKGETHYFVMTARKHSLLSRRVLLKDDPDVAVLLSRSNINQRELLAYVRDLANIVTGFAIPNLEVSQFGDSDDVALFDFTSSKFSRHSSHAILRACPQGKPHPCRCHRLLTCLVGDSLRQPFWPEGTGCGRGFVSAYDTAFFIRQWLTNEIDPVAAVIGRESVYSRYAGLKQESLNKNAITKFSVEPTARYKQLVVPISSEKVLQFIESDVALSAPQAVVLSASLGHTKHCQTISTTRLNRWLKSKLDAYVLQSYCKLPINTTTVLASPLQLTLLLHSYRPNDVDLHAATRLCQDDPQLAWTSLLKELSRHFNTPCDGPPVTLQHLYALYASLQSAKQTAPLVLDYQIRVRAKTVRTPVETMTTSVHKTDGVNGGSDFEHSLGLSSLSSSQPKQYPQVKKLPPTSLPPTSTPREVPPSVRPSHRLHASDEAMRALGLLCGGSGPASQEQASPGNGATSTSQLDPELKANLYRLMTGAGSGDKKPQETSSAHAPKKLDLSAYRPLLPQDKPSLNELLPLSGNNSKLRSMDFVPIPDEQKNRIAQLLEKQFLGIDADDEVEKTASLKPDRPLGQHSVAQLAVKIVKNDSSSPGLSQGNADARITENQSHVPIREIQSRIQYRHQNSVPSGAKIHAPGSILDLQNRIAQAQAASSRQHLQKGQAGGAYQPSECYVCGDRVFPTERFDLDSLIFHRSCFQCTQCHLLLRPNTYSSAVSPHSARRRFFCKNHQPRAEPTPKRRKIPKHLRQAMIGYDSDSTSASSSSVDSLNSSPSDDDNEAALNRRPTSVGDNEPTRSPSTRNESSSSRHDEVIKNDKNFILPRILRPLFAPTPPKNPPPKEEHPPQSPPPVINLVSPITPCAAPFKLSLSSPRQMLYGSEDNSPPKNLPVDSSVNNRNGLRSDGSSPIIWESDDEEESENVDCDEDDDDASDANGDEISTDENVTKSTASVVTVSTTATGDDETDGPVGFSSRLVRTTAATDAVQSILARQSNWLDNQLQQRRARQIEISSAKANFFEATQPILLPASSAHNDTDGEKSIPALEPPQRFTIRPSPEDQTPSDDKGFDTSVIDDVTCSEVPSRFLKSTPQMSFMPRQPTLPSFLPPETRTSNVPPPLPSAPMPSTFVDTSPLPATKPTVIPVTLVEAVLPPDSNNLLESIGRIGQIEYSTAERRAKRQERQILKQQVISPPVKFSILSSPTNGSVPPPPLPATSPPEPHHHGNDDINRHSNGEQSRESAKRSISVQAARAAFFAA